MASPFSLRLPEDLLAAIDAFAKSRSITRSKAIQMACAQFIETGAADPLEERFTSLEARVAALEGK